MIKRYIQSEIERWIQDGNNALLVTGARQVGKTYVIRNCLKNQNVNYQNWFSCLKIVQILRIF